MAGLGSSVALSLSKSVSRHRRTPFDRLRAAVLMIGLMLSAIAAPAAAQADGRLIDWEGVASAHVQPRNVTIWLPPGYDAGRRRYPVIYMHDGQNIFVPGRAYGGNEWGVDEALSRMMAAGQTRGAIVVGIWNTDRRGREYLPTKVAALLSPEARALVETTHGGPSVADGYLRFIVTELKPRIDREFRTRPGRRDTSIMGSSMGGLISLYAMGEYPQVFGQAAALSVHWPLGDPRQGQGAPQEQVIAAFDGWLASSRARASRNRLYMDHGSINLDGYYRPYSVAMEDVLPRHGWRIGTNFTSRVFDGTDHNEAAWRDRVEIPLTFLLDGR
jgi:enterochelin esterase-like enzyme